MAQTPKGDEAAFLKTERNQLYASAGRLGRTAKRVQAEEELRKLSRAVEQSPSTVIITDTCGSIEYVNPRFTQITGYTLQEVVGQNPRLLKSGQHPTEFYADLWDTILAGKEWRGEFVNRKKNGEFYWELASVSPIRNAEEVITHFVKVAEDITERVRVEQALQRAHDELERRVEERTTELEATNRALKEEIAERARAEQRLHGLAQQVVSAQEQERQRVSRELHDEAGQALTALKISLELVQSDLPPGFDLLYQRLGEAIGLTDTTLEQIRLLAQNLRPPALDAVGLNATLESFCYDFAQRTRLSVDYAGLEIPELTDAVSVSLYRFLQEALTNVAKHAHARQVQVTLLQDAETISLAVEDDGRGSTQRP